MVTNKAGWQAGLIAAAGCYRYTASLDGKPSIHVAYQIISSIPNERGDWQSYTSQYIERCVEPPPYAENSF